MKGVIVLAMKEMVKENFGEDRWLAALKKAGIEKDPSIVAISDVDDPIVMKVVQALCEVLGITLAQAGDAFGDYWVNVYSQNMYRAHYLGTKTAKEFLLKMDSVHLATTETMAGARPPRFEYEWQGEKTLIMKYKSHRGLIDFLVGLVKGVAKLYEENLHVTKLGMDKVQIQFP